MTLPKNCKWVVPGEYYMAKHHKFEGILELWLIDQNGASHCIQNFCLEESALTLAKEDKFWREAGYTISHTTKATHDIKWLDTTKKKVERWAERVAKEFESEEEEDKPTKKTPKSEEEKKEARKQRRLARKAAEKGKTN